MSLIDGIGFNITDPVASGSLLSPKQYRTFSLPYTQRLVQAMKEESELEVTIHICGDTSKILPDLAQTGVDFISLDQKVDLAEAKASVGDQVGIIGNVDPVQYFLDGHPESMEGAVRTSFKNGV